MMKKAGELMYYLDTNLSYINFEQTIYDDIYVDKTMLIEKISHRLNKKSSKYICITRPRRFGKTINANMLGAYYTVGYDSHTLFKDLMIAKTEGYETHLNKHHVIYIDFSRLPDPCDGFKDYIDFIREELFHDLVEAYGVEKRKGYSVADYFKMSNDRFIFILDEWDSIFYKGFMKESDKRIYLEFLKGLLKDQPYVELAYMTGVLPIAKYSTGSELNMFEEYSFMKDDVFETYFGFHEDEVKVLCKNNKLNYDELKYWYDGYSLENGKSLFNPRSVVSALTRGKCRNYWTETGPMNEVADCIEHNVDALREDIVKMVSGIPVQIKLKGYSATQLQMTTRDEILSAMVVYGFLSYHDGELRIPNHELMEKFEGVLERDSMKEIAQIVKQSGAILKATLEKNETAVAQYLEEIHDREIPFLAYHDENSLACVVTLSYLYARNDYDITREAKSGKGYVDFLFTPKRKGYPAIVLELKWNKSAADAIRQMKERQYINKVKEYDEILFVGINYDKQTKKHECIIEEAYPFK